MLKKKTIITVSILTLAAVSTVVIILLSIKNKTETGIADTTVPRYYFIYNDGICSRYRVLTGDDKENFPDNIDNVEKDIVGNKGKLIGKQGDFVNIYAYRNDDSLKYTVREDLYSNQIVIGIFDQSYKADENKAEYIYKTFGRLMSEAYGIDKYSQISTMEIKGENHTKTKENADEIKKLFDLISMSEYSEDEKPDKEELRNVVITLNTKDNKKLDFYYYEAKGIISVYDIKYGKVTGYKVDRGLFE